MKTVKTIAILTIASLTILSSCKKGANDPFLSLHSRKARVAGDWTLKKFDETYTSGSTTTVTTYDGTTKVETTSGSSSSSTYSLKYKFDKKGTYTMTQTETISGWTDQRDETGTWNFTSGVGKDKNKDHIVIKTLTQTNKSGTLPASTTTYTGDDAPVAMYYLDELKNKTMVLKYEGTYASGSSKESDKQTMTFEQ